MRRSFLALLAGVICAPTVLSGQNVRRDPGVMINGQIVVRVYVQLAEDDPPYRPLAPIEVRFYRGARDSVVAFTDGAGALSTLLDPGDWRLVTITPIRGTRRIWAWSVPIVVKEWMPPVELKGANALTAGPAVRANAAPPSAAARRAKSGKGAKPDLEADR